MENEAEVSPLQRAVDVIRPHWMEDAVPRDQVRDLLAAGLTRRAWLLENRGGQGHHHEPLEWLGDRMLGAVVAAELWRRFPHAAPGRLDLARDALTSERPLAMIARELDLQSNINMGRGEAMQGQVSSDSVLSDHVEAFIGAAFLVAGWAGVQALVHHLLRDRWPAALPAEDARAHQAPGRSPRTALNEVVQARFRANIPKDDWQDTRLSAANEPPVFQSSVTLPDGSVHQGVPVQGKIKDARSSAAEVALAYLRRSAGDV